jgi:Ca-activated chloride channel homolog
VTDDLDDLKAALKAAPAPDADAKARAMALAMENFDRLHDSLQGSTNAARSSEDRPDAVPLNGVRRMLKFLTSRPALAATTSVAALVIGVAVILPVTGLQIGQKATTPETPTTEVQGETDKPVKEKPVETAEGAAPTGGETAVTAEAMAENAQPGTVEISPRSEPAPAITDERGAADDADAATALVVEEPAPEPEPVVEQELADALTATTETPKSEAPAETGSLSMGEEAAPPAATAERKREQNGGDISLSGSARFGLVLDGEADSSVAYLPTPATDTTVAPVENTEEYANEPVNPAKVTAEEPVSTFSIDVDTASWAVVRSTLNMAMLPTPDQVRIEEMINYFPYAYKAPTAEEAFSSTISVMPTPWNPGTRLVTIGIQGALPEVEARPPLNLVFLIDTSGSMEDPNKLPLLKQSLSLMLAELRPEDEVAMVVYAGSAGQVLAPTKAAERDTILRALDNLAAGGSTAGAEGLELAYQVAEGMKSDNEVTRILLATDGDFNVGVSDPEGLEAYVAKKRETGTYLSVLGFGRGNLDDAIMQALAENGNGTAAYIDTLSEARKVLVDQLTGALYPIADDVKIQVEWNPATVAEYRLIGYETRALRREDFNNDKVDAGEIGAGTQVTAIYEVTAPGSDALLNDPLRYGTATAEGTAGELGFLRLRWKAPGEDASTLIETPIKGNEEATAETRFAAAIAGFGQLLQGSTYTGDWGWDQAIELALSARGDDPYGYRIEAVNLMRLAQSLSAN